MKTNKQKKISLENELDSTKWKRRQTETAKGVAHFDLPAFRQTFANIYFSRWKRERHQLKNVQERDWCQCPSVIDSGYFFGTKVSQYIFQGSMETVDVYIFKKQLLVAYPLDICLGK